jgi:hypothetical protein
MAVWIPAVVASGKACLACADNFCKDESTLIKFGLAEQNAPVVATKFKKEQKRKSRVSR